MQQLNWTESVFPVCTLLILLLYHVHYYFQVKRSPMQTAIGITQYLRTFWVETVMEQKRDILAVQTLRNWVMASSLLASTAVLISIGLLSYLFQQNRIIELPFSAYLIIGSTRNLDVLKILLLFLNFSFAFLNFTLSIRYYNHVNFMINVPLDRDDAVTVGYISRILNLGMLHYTLGMRAYYLAGPLLLWLFGPVWMLLGSVVLVGILYRIDRTA
ncbi:DUF599 domain-containing protein [Desulfobacca acetoxidans]|uniref:DUF599 domain-containing protein n=1 Tax=Desulfobacca acetoxidans (strain ATCC 700848 / DSM 11109 / ASRB2) TaxID=880072 RepID=F2NI93_DESAR|nr:DUF599 domain-containing protein [Desulfobacca acetoxidans]AEB09862.1 protein of unknown function DUF599 [Desulfobacca acetoxidans DSM 11109]